MGKLRLSQTTQTTLSPGLHRGGGEGRGGGTHLCCLRGLGFLPPHHCPAHPGTPPEFLSPPNAITPEAIPHSPTTPPSPTGPQSALPVLTLSGDERADHRVDCPSGLVENWLDWGQLLSLTTQSPDSASPDPASPDSASLDSASP